MSAPTRQERTEYVLFGVLFVSLVAILVLAVVIIYTEAVRNQAKE